MSAEVESDTIMCCAACGIADTEVDGGKLKTCIACKSARYCSVKCQRGHWPQHKRACKKRAAELMSCYSSNSKAAITVIVPSVLHLFGVTGRKVV